MRTFITCIPHQTLIRVIKSRRSIWVEYIAHMRHVYNILVGKLERPKYREDNILDLGETGWESVSLIHLAHERNQRWVL
jgi:hypothetical protein